MITLRYTLQINHYGKNGLRHTVFLHCVEKGSHEFFIELFNDYIKGFNTEPDKYGYYEKVYIIIE